MDDANALGNALTLASPLIKSLVDTYVTPKLQSFKEKYAAEKIENKIPTDENFTQYYHRTFKKLSVINTLVNNNSQRFLDDIFIPLTLVPKNPELKIKTKIKGFPKTISDRFGNILITDTAGMGKSTLMKKIFLDCISKKIGIPIFIELRRLSATKGLMDELKEQLDSNSTTLDSQKILELLSEGNFIIILDGYDEISLSEIDTVTTDIQDFISKSPNNRFFLTSRPEKALKSFGNFQEFKIEPLSKKEAFELLRKFDNQGQVSQLLIKKLQEEELSNIEEFLTNPLLVSLLFTAFEHKQSIPFKKYLFYRQVYDANFENHDLTKGDSYTHGKYSKLVIDEFHRILRHIGFNCFKLQRIEFTKDELLKLILQSKEFCVGLNFQESDFLLDILKTVPLFTQDGNYYRWSHKSLQEYFAAQFIYSDSKNKQIEILEKIYDSPNLEKFINILDLYYDMDYKTFRNVIELKFLREYKQTIISTYLNVDPAISNIDINTRRELLFLVDSYLFSEDESLHNSNKFKLMLDKYVNENNLDRNKISGVIHNPAEDILCLNYSHTKYSLLRLFLNKKNPIVKRFRNPEPIPNFQFDFKIHNKFELFKIDDNIDNKYNSFNDFSKVNTYIGLSRIENFVINHDIALQKLQEIENSIITEAKSDFLLGGI